MPAEPTDLVPEPTDLVSEPTDLVSEPTDVVSEPAHLVSVIVPVYNERATVAEALRRIRRAPLPTSLQTEVVVVDDGSTDGSGKILGALEDSTVRVVTHPRNRGKGAAVRSGLQVARGDLVLLHDADLEYDPDDWPGLLEPLLGRKATVVYGSRFQGQGTMAPSQRLVSRLVTLSANLLYRGALSDLQTGAKAFARQALDGLTLESDGFAFEAEITAKLLRQGHRIVEVPVTYRGRRARDGRKIRWRDAAAMAGALVRLRLDGVAPVTTSPSTATAPTVPAMANDAEV